jgi:intein/homing endonuclease
MIRQAFIPREGCHLVEVDFSGIEVRIACAYNKDPNLKRYIEDPTTDMHRDTAMELFSLAVDQVEKRTTRDWTKNRFVFPEFYGSVYFQCAPHIWEAVVASEGKVPGADTTIRGWLEKQGIKELGDCNPRGRPRPGTFEFRVKEVEELFWKKRFVKYHQWKQDWFAAYQKNGGFKTLTGFWIGAIGGKQGLLKRNDVNNYPIQGCLAGSSKVLTKKGLIPIKELVGVHTQVWTGFRWADAIGLDRGVCRRAIIRLSSGLVIRCDTRHKLKNENGEWICFDDLRVGDLVALPKIGDQTQPSKEMNWSFIFGFIIGDGCLRYERENLSIVVGKKKKPILESIRKFFLEQGYKDGGYRGVHWKVIPAQGNKAEKYALQIQNKELAAFLKSKGFDFSWKSKTKRIPASVWTSSVQEQRDFMEGLWLSDGTRVVGSEKNLNMTNLKLLKEVQILISTMGFDSYIDKNKMLRVCWREYKSKPKRKYPYTAIKRLVSKVDRKNYDDECQYITDKRNFGGGKPPSQYVGERIIERNSTGSEVYRFDSIVSIEVLPKEETTYTMTVNDPLHQFVADGVIHKNSAFHCLLWTLIQLTREIRKRKMKTKVVGQIHDSVIADVPEREIQDYLEMAKRIMTVDLPKAWTWINVPLDTEAEVCPLGGSWHTKAVWEKAGGVWCPKKKK